MIFGNSVDSIVHKRKTFFYILLYQFIDFCHCPALIFRIQFGLRLVHIRNTKIGISRFRIICLAEHIYKYEMCIRPAYQSLST